MTGSRFKAKAGVVGTTSTAAMPQLLSRVSLIVNEELLKPLKHA